MRIPEKLRTLTQRLVGPCPMCNCGHLVRKTRNADSPFMRWVECPKPGCTYQASLKDFTDACIKPRRAKLRERKNIKQGNNG